MDYDEITVASPKHQLASTSLDPVIATNISTVPTLTPKPKLKRPSTNAPTAQPPQKGPQTKRPRVSTDGKYGFEQPAKIGKESVKDDLEGYGFTKEQVKEMVDKREAPCDADGVKAEDREQRASVKRRRVNGSNGGEKYEPLFLGDGKKWALFDPNEGFPSAWPDLPAFLEKWATFVRGNERILEYNVKSQSVRTKSTPRILRDGKGIDYTTTGPKLINLPTTAAAAKKTRGRPRKSGETANGVEMAEPTRSKLRRSDSSEDTVIHARSCFRGRPKKAPIKLEYSEDVNEDESDSSLTDLELADDEDDDDGDWVGEEVEVKREVQIKREIGDSEDE